MLWTRRIATTLSGSGSRNIEDRLVRSSLPCNRLHGHWRFGSSIGSFITDVVVKDVSATAHPLLA